MTDDDDIYEILKEKDRIIQEQETKIRLLEDIAAEFHRRLKLAEYSDAPSKVYTDTGFWSD